MLSASKASVRGFVLAGAAGLAAQLAACSNLPARSAGAQPARSAYTATSEVVSPSQGQAAREATERGRRCREHRGIRAVRSVGCTDREVDLLLGTLPDANRGLDRVVP